MFEKSNFFILPTRQDCTPIVFAEASSFALPSIAIKTGGVESMVKDNINGMTFSISDSPEEYANYIASFFNNREKYEKLCLSTFEYYKNQLNWNTTGEQLIAVIKAICE